MREKSDTKEQFTLLALKISVKIEYNALWNALKGDRKLL